MTKRMLIDASHPEETRVVVLDGNRLEDFDLEAANRLPLKGNIYLAKVVRVEPSLQAAFVEYGGNRHGFLPLAEIHPDYYQIPIADRQRLLEMQAAEAREEEAEDDEEAEAAGGASGSHAASGTDAGRTPPGAASAEERREEAEPAVTMAPPPVEAAIQAGEPPPAPAAEVPAVAPPATETPEAETARPTEAPAEPDAAAAPSPEIAAAPAPAEQAPAAGDAAPAIPPEPEAEAASEPEVAAEAPPAVEDAAPAPAEQSGPILLAPQRPGEGEQPDIGGAGAVRNGRGEEDSFDSDDAPPPEDIGGEGTEDVARERRASTRLMRQYKIQEVIKRRQIMLVQVVKEERGTKGAALTTYISLAGRFSVLMPNSPRGGGVSRKITSASDRRRLREVIDELGLPDGMGLIVRTAGAQRPKPEIRRDGEYLLRLWDSIRERTLASSAPALIYEEADLIKRSIRDNYARDVDEVLVDGEDAYQEAREFMRMLMPQQAQKVRLYREGGLFARHGVEAQLDAMHSPVVQLRSGGYIVINQTEALVAIDVNSGRATRERHIEDTAYRTNMEAADEIARQLRLRDLAGLIVIDFIDMESSRHDAAVERRLKEALRHDRARIQVGRISHFGLLEMSRQRLRPSLAETAFVTCQHCQGRGQVRSIESSALSVLRAIEEEGAKRRAAEIAVHVASPVALYLLNRKRDRLARIEARFGMSVVFEPDDSLQPPALRIDRLRVADPNHRPAEAPSALRMDYAPEPEEDEEEEAPPADAAAEAAADDEGEGAAEGRPNGRAAEDGAEDAGDEGGRRRRRRRRRRGARGDSAEAAAGDDAAESEEDGDTERAEAAPATPDDGQQDGDAAEAEAGEASAAGDEAPGAAASEEAPRRRRRRRGGRTGTPPRGADEGEGDEADAPPPQQRAPTVQRYSGPTPADPFAGHVDDIMAAMEAAEAAAEAAAQAAASLAGRRGRAPAPPAAEEAPAGTGPQAEASAAPAAPEEPVLATPAATEALLASYGAGEMPEPAADGPATPAAAEAEAAVAAPAAAEAPQRAEAEPAAPQPTPEPVQGPAVRPRLVEEADASAPRRSGWWRR